MITLQQYFFGGKGKEGAKLVSPDASADRILNAETLLDRVNRLLFKAHEEGVYNHEVDEDTGNQISGVHGGSGDGGFRLSTTKTGVGLSSHKEGKGVDVYDPGNRLDSWISTYDYNNGLSNYLLEDFGLYREHPSATSGWCHLTTRDPGDGRRTFYP